MGVAPFVLASLAFASPQLTMESKLVQQPGTRKRMRIPSFKSRFGIRKRQRVSVPAILRLRAPEKKAVDTARQGLNFIAGGSFLLVNGIVPGAAGYQRVGRKISMNSLAIRGWVYFAQAGAAPTFDFLRMLVVYDRQPNGALPALADILLDCTSAGATATESTSNVNLNNADRFKILKEQVWATPGAAAAAAYSGINENTPLEFKIYLKLNGLETHYNNGVAGTIADITTGALYLITVGLNGAADYQYRAGTDTRLRYTDM